MHKSLISILAVVLFIVSAGEAVLSAQCIRQDEQAVLRKTDAGSFNVYDADAPKVITPVPDGYMVVGISHYGRHGSRYCTDDYREILPMFEEMHKAKCLSERGEQVYASYKALMPFVAGRDGELVQLGRRQHAGIAERMVSAYPSLFTSDAILTARSTLVPRCIESMGAFCEQVARMRPDVLINQEAASSYYLGEVSAMQDYVYYYNIKNYKEPGKKLKKEWEQKLLQVDGFERMLCDVSKRNSSAYRKVVKDKNLKKIARCLRNTYFTLPFADDCDPRAIRDFLYAIDGGDPAVVPTSFSIGSEYGVDAPVPACAAVSGAGLSGTGVSGTGASGARVSGAAVSGSGVSGAAPISPEGRPVLPPLFDDQTWMQLGRVEASRHIAELGHSIVYHGVINIFMVDRILRMAEEDLASGKAFVRLRFGHDSILQAFLVDCGIRGWQVWESCDTLTRDQAMNKTLDHWCLSRIPMASNLQIVFYRRNGAGEQGIAAAAAASAASAASTASTAAATAASVAPGQAAPEVLFKMLLNESELELPIPAVCGRTYDWAAFMAYMQPRIREGIARAHSILEYPYPIPRQ